MADLAVLIPTVNRHEKLHPLVVDLVANTHNSFHVYFILELWDSESREAVARMPHTTTISGDFGSCSVAMNRGFRLSSEPYVFTGNDDLEFPPNWDKAAVEKVKEGWPIVGVQEGHNRMTCFTMVERAYIERESGVFDQANQLYHPYQSQYVDTEFADYAKARGVWAEAPEGGVIHRHHDFGDADPNHPNYQKARATLGADWATYRERKPQWEAAARG